MAGCYLGLGGDVVRGGAVGGCWILVDGGAGDVGWIGWVWVGWAKAEQI